MELWLDTVDFELIKQTNKILNITGVTTNPTIFSKSTLGFNETINKLLDIQNGLVAVQVIADDYNGMITQAQKFYTLSNRVIIKIPVTINGVQAINYLAKNNIPTLATAVFNTKQLLLSSNAGANYIAPYLGRIENCFKVLEEMINIIKINGYSIKIMGAAIRDMDYIINAVKLGIHAITLPQSAIEDLLSDIPQTLDSLQKFRTDWKFGDDFINA